MLPPPLPQSTRVSFSLTVLRSAPLGILIE